MSGPVISKVRPVVLGLMVCVPVAVSAQPAWRVLDGEEALFEVHGDTLEVPLGMVRDSLTQSGFPLARIDSVADSTIWVTSGPRVLVRSIDIEGLPEGMRAGEILAIWETKEGERLDSSRLSEDLLRLQEALHREGWPAAEVQSTVELTMDPPGYQVRAVVRPGDTPPLSGIVLPGGRRTKESIVARLTGIQLGEPVERFDARQIRRDLEQTELFEFVGEPAFVQTEEGALMISIPVEEVDPGRFDIVLGYQPPQDGVGGGVVGSGKIDLYSPFGEGRTLNLALNRTPGLISTFDAAVSDPFFLGSPIGVAAAFSGRSQDSTFSHQRISAEVSTRLSSSVQVGLIGSRESLDPGRAGDTINRSTTWLAGVSVEIRSLDRFVSPRQGVAVESSFETGVRAFATDSLGSTRRQRLSLEVRGYLPTFINQGVVLGLDARSLIGRGLGPGDEASRFDEGELFRWGGASRLRGYDEDEVVGTTVGRLFSEYRFGFDARSFLFGFVDLGFVDRPELATLPARRELLPGYGVGIRVATALGLTTLTYALNPDLSPTRGKIHLSLNFGL